MADITHIMSDIDAIRKRLGDCPIPADARSDWEGTNHYEITSAQNFPESVREGGYWWIDGPQLFLCGKGDWSATEEGKRWGAVMDYACAYSRDVTALLARIDEQAAEIAVRRQERNLDNDRIVDLQRKIEGLEADALEDATEQARIEAAFKRVRPEAHSVYDALDTIPVLRAEIERLKAELALLKPSDSTATGGTR